MSSTSKIQWTEATWNPTVGCTKVSAGCDHCYAEKLVNRFAGSKGFPERFDTLVLRDHFLELPLRWRKPRRVFVNSLSDLFHRDIPDQFIARVFAVMARAQQHTFQVLTKRPARMKALLTSDLFRRQMYDWLVCIDLAWIDANPLPWPLSNVWLGVSAEDQHWANVRLPALANTPAAVRWVSAEPLLGDIDLGRFSWLDWAVVGGESGPGARRMDLGWVANMLEDRHVPLFVKQLGTVQARELGLAHRKGGDIDDWPTWLRVRDWPMTVHPPDGAA